MIGTLALIAELFGTVSGLGGVPTHGFPVYCNVPTMKSCCGRSCVSAAPCIPLEGLHVLTFSLEQFGPLLAPCSSAHIGLGLG